MKTLITIIGVLLATALVVNAQNKETRALDSFDEVKVGESVRLILVKGNKHEAVIETSGVDAENVETYVSGGMLRVGMARGSWRSINVTVTVTYKELSGVKVSSSAKLSSDETIKANDFYVDVSSSGRVTLKIDVDKLKVEVSSSGNINLSGRAKTQTIDASSSGRYSGFDLMSDGVRVDVSSSAKVEINVNKEIYADASSSGKVQYKGSPQKVIVEASSSGKVSSAD